MAQSLEEYRKELYGIDDNRGVLGWISSMGKETGSIILDVLSQLDRPRNALWVGMNEALKEDDPTAFFGGASRGWKREEVIRGRDLLKDRYPDWVKEHPYYSGFAAFGIDLATDPLMYIGPGMMKGIGKGIGALTPEWLQKGGRSLGQTDLARSLNIYTGESRDVKMLADAAKGRMRGANMAIEQDVKALQAKITSLSQKAGVSYDAAAKAVNQSVETARAAETGGKAMSVRDSLIEMGRGDVRWYGLPRSTGGLQKIADDQAGRYHQMYLAEKSAGVPISDIMRRANDMGVEGYVPHILSAEARRRQGVDSFKNWFRDPSKHPSVTARKMPGTVQAINQRKIKDMISQRLKKKLGKTPTEKQIAAEIKKLSAAGKLPQFMHTDPALLMGVREARHSMGMEGATYLKEVGKKFGHTSDDYKKMVAAGALPDDWVKAVGLKTHYLPPSIAKVVNAQSKMLTDPTTTNQFLRHFDQVQGLWKAWSLAVRPAYHARNLVGNIWNAYSLAGVKNPDVYRQAQKIQNQAMRGRLSKTDTIAGRSYDDIYKQARDHGLLGRGQYGADIVRSIEETLERGTGIAAGKASALSRALGTRSLPIRAGFRFGNAVENNARLGVFINSLKKGKTPEQAAYDVKKSLFDYSDLSMFERNVMKRLIPFYTWSRKNIPANIEAILKNPQRYQALNTARLNIEHEDGRPDPEATDWWGKRVPIYLGKEGEEDVWKMITLLNYIPVADLERLGSPADLIGEMTSPFIKEPLEQLFNYDLFRDQEIQKWKGQKEDFLGIPMPKRIAKLAKNIVVIAELNRANPFGIFGEALRDEVTGDISRTRSFEKLKGDLFGIKDYEIDLPGGGLTERVGEGGYDIARGSRLLRYLAGIRVFDVDERKGRYFQKKGIEDDLQELLRYLRKASRSGRVREIAELERLINMTLSGAETNPLLQ